VKALEQRGFGEDRRNVHARPRALPRKPALPQTACGPCLTDISDAGYNRSAVTNQKTLGSVKTMAAAEAWGAALLMAQLWVLASVAA